MTFEALEDRVLRPSETKDMAALIRLVWLCIIVDHQEAANSRLITGLGPPDEGLSRDLRPRVGLRYTHRLKHDCRSMLIDQMIRRWSANDGLPCFFVNKTEERQMCVQRTGE